MCYVKHIVLLVGLCTMLALPSRGAGESQALKLIPVVFQVSRLWDHTGLPDAPNLADGAGDSRQVVRFDILDAIGVQCVR